MAILRGFPPSNRVSTSLPPDNRYIGEFRVADNEDPTDGCRIKLDTGQWVYPRWRRTTGYYDAPPVDSLVRIWGRSHETAGFIYFYETDQMPQTHTLTLDLIDVDDVLWESEGF